MEKFKVNIPCDYVTGHLRYGHYEGVIECENEEKIKEMIRNDEVRDFLNLVIDSYEVEDCDYDYKKATYKSLEEEDSND